MADLEHRSSRVVDQGPAVVHDRLLELAVRLRDELPPIREGTQAAQLMGVTGSLGVEVADRGPDRIELRTTRGRLRGQAAVTLVPQAAAGTASPVRQTHDRQTHDRTKLDAAILIRPDGLAANLMLGAALQARPQLRAQVVDGFERALDDLATELAKPDGEWDARSWTPPGLSMQG